MFLNWGFAQQTSSTTLETLNRYQLLYIFYTSTSSGSLQVNSAPLAISNLEKTDPLYPVLQQARDEGYFPNYQGELPKTQTAKQEDLWLLLHYKYGIQIKYQENEPLSFTWMRSQLQPYICKPDSEIQIQTQEYNGEAILQQISEILENDSYYAEEIKKTKDRLPFPRSLSEMNDYLAQLSDPYASYYTPNEAQIFMNSLESKLSGIGAVLNLSEEWMPVVAWVLEESPAQQAGIKVGDHILAVNGKRWEKDQDFNLFISTIRGEAESQLEIELLRKEQILKLKLKRANLKIPVINWSKQWEQCLIEIFSFDLESSQEFFAQANKLQPCQTWIFDLRGNPWGVVDEVLKILDAFIPTGKQLLRFAGNQHHENYYALQSDFNFWNQEIKIIIDKNSASAAEIFAGVLKFYWPQHVQIIGEKSFGKGSAQSLVELLDHSLLKYTIALWYIADQHSSIDKIWIQPDITLIDNPETEVDEILAYLGFGEE